MCASPGADALLVCAVLRLWPALRDARLGRRQGAGPLPAHAARAHVVHLDYAFPLRADPAALCLLRTRLAPSVRIRAAGALRPGQRTGAAGRLAHVPNADAHRGERASAAHNGLHLPLPARRVFAAIRASHPAQHTPYTPSASSAPPLRWPVRSTSRGAVR